MFGIDVPRAARKLLGLPAAQAHDLFVSHWLDKGGDLHNDVTPEQAAEYIRKLVRDNARAS